MCAERINRIDGRQGRCAPLSGLSSVGFRSSIGPRQPVPLSMLNNQPPGLMAAFLIFAALVIVALFTNHSDNSHNTYHQPIGGLGGGRNSRKGQEAHGDRPDRL